MNNLFNNNSEIEVRRTLDQRVPGETIHANHPKLEDIAWTYELGKCKSIYHPETLPYDHDVIFKSLDTNKIYRFEKWCGYGYRNHRLSELRRKSAMELEELEKEYRELGYYEIPMEYRFEVISIIDEKTDPEVIPVFPRGDELREAIKKLEDEVRKTANVIPEDAEYLEVEFLQESYPLLKGEKLVAENWGTMWWGFEKEGYSGTLYLPAIRNSKVCRIRVIPTKKEADELKEKYYRLLATMSWEECRQLYLNSKSADEAVKS